MGLPAPIITVAPRVIHVGDLLGVSGISEPHHFVLVEFHQGKFEDKIKVYVDPQGRWNALFPNFLKKAGAGFVIATLVDDFGALSVPSTPWPLRITAVPYLQIGPIIFTKMQFLLALIIILLICSALFMLFGRRLRRLFLFLRRETRENLNQIRRELARMHRDLEDHTSSIKRFKLGALDKGEQEFHHRLEKEMEQLKHIAERTQKIIDDYLKGD